VYKRAKRLHFKSFINFFIIKPGIEDVLGFLIFSNKIIVNIKKHNLFRYIKAFLSENILCFSDNI